MQQLSINRYFKHRYFKDVVIKSTMEKSSTPIAEGVYPFHLYIELVSGDDRNEIVGMSGSQKFMLGTCIQEERWTDMLVQWAEANQYDDYYPKQFTQAEALAVLQECREMKSQGQRIGQALINMLNQETPTPNIAIFNSDDEQVVTDWFFSKHVTMETESEVA